MNVAGFIIDDSVATQAALAADNAGCPRGLVIGIGIVESDGNPLAVSPIDSNGYRNVGFLQLNQGGQGAGYSVSTLQDLATNLSLGVPPIAAAWKQYGPSDLWTVLQAAGHPGWVDTSTALGQSLVALWTRTGRPDLGGRSPLAFIASAIQSVPSQSPSAPAPAPAQERQAGYYVETATGPLYIAYDYPPDVVAQLEAQAGGLVGQTAGDGNGVMLPLLAVAGLGYLLWRH